MISLKRNSKGVLVEAKGRRTRASSIYNSNQSQLFRVSRSRFADFLTCKRCFYLDRVEGVISPSTPGWTLNETTDILLKREFDRCREKQIPHRVFHKFGLTNVVPFRHEELDRWRDSLHHGLSYQFRGSNITLHGGVDDIWLDCDTNKLIVVEYKSQSTSGQVNVEQYLNGTYRGGYKVQLDFYAYLLIKMGFDVSPVGYFYVCNASRDVAEFRGLMAFEETIVPYEWNIDWIDNKVLEMIDVMNSPTLPEPNHACENCAYAHQRALIEEKARG